MNKEILYYNLKIISEKLTQEQIFYARRNRNWEKFDKLSEVEKLLYRLEEFQIYEDILNDNDENNFDD
jgi:hypothetical protein